VLPLIIAHFPGRDEIDAHSRVRCLEGHVIGTAKPMDQPSAARSYRSSEVPRPACAAAWTCLNREA
jgi:hypothetical protein